MEKYIVVLCVEKLYILGYKIKLNFTLFTWQIIKRVETDGDFPHYIFYLWFGVMERINSLFIAAWTRLLCLQASNSIDLQLLRDEQHTTHPTSNYRWIVCGCDIRLDSGYSFHSCLDIFHPTHTRSPWKTSWCIQKELRFITVLQDTNNSRYWKFEFTFEFPTKSIRGERRRSDFINFEKLSICFIVIGKAFSYVFCTTYFL